MARVRSTYVGSEPKVNPDMDPDSARRVHAVAPAVPHPELQMDDRHQSEHSAQEAIAQLAASQTLDIRV
ncbi:MAG: hypothetical protein ABUL49_01680 [bacterium]